MKLTAWYKKRTNLTKTQPRVKFPKLLSEKENNPQAKVIETPTEAMVAFGHKWIDGWPTTGYGPASGFAPKSAPHAIIAGNLNERHDPVVAHEQMHKLFQHVAAKYGEPARHRLISKLLTHADPLAVQSIQRALRSPKFGYTDKEKSFKEEVFNYFHTYLTDHKNRNRIKIENNIPWLDRQVDRSIKRSWRAMLAVAPHISATDILPKIKKALDDKQWEHSIVHNHSSSDAANIDHTYHMVNSQPPKAFNALISHPQPINMITTTGMAPKMVHDVTQFQHPDDGQSYTPGGHIMIKPYHQKPNAGYNLPIYGWATMTTKNLLHAAGLGHMSEDVSVAEHQKIPVTVHSFASKDHKHADSYYSPDWKGGPRFKANPMDIQKLTVMDYLTDNQDRHTENILVGHKPENSQYNKLLALDHERNFQYADLEEHNPMLYTRASGTKAILNEHGISGSLESPESREELATWWKEHGPKIKQEMESNVLAMQDEDLRNHVRENFHARWDRMNDWATDGKENNWKSISPFHASFPRTASKTFHSRMSSPQEALDLVQDKSPGVAASILSKVVARNPKYARSLRYHIEGLGKKMSNEELADYFIVNAEHPDIDVKHMVFFQHPLQRQAEIASTIKAKLERMHDAKAQQLFPFVERAIEAIHNRQMGIDEKTQPYKAM